MTCTPSISPYNHMSGHITICNVLDCPIGLTVVLCLQGYILQLPSARAALGLPSAPMRLSAASQQGTAPLQASPIQQALVKGPAVEGTPGAVPIVKKGAKGTPSRQPRPVDMDKLLTVSAAVRKLAAGTSDAHTLLLQVWRALCYFNGMASIVIFSNLYICGKGFNVSV